MSNSGIKTGCEFWDDCFTCPFTPDCIAGTGAKRELMLKKAEAIRLSKEGHSVEEIAKKLGRSVRQIKRYLAGAGQKNLTNIVS